MFTKEQFLKILESERQSLINDGKPVNQVAVIACYEIEDGLNKPYPMEYLLAKMQFLTDTNPLTYQKAGK